MIDGEKEKGVQDLGLCTPFFIALLVHQQKCVAAHKF